MHVFHSHTLQKLFSSSMPDNFIGVVCFVEVRVLFLLTGISCEACITYLTDEPHRHPAPDSGVKPLWKIVGLLKRESTLWIRSFISERLEQKYNLCTFFLFSRSRICLIFTEKSFVHGGDISETSCEIVPSPLAERVHA